MVPSAYPAIGGIQSESGFNFSIYEPINIKQILYVKGSLLKYKSALKSVKPFLRLMWTNKETNR